MLFGGNQKGYITLNLHHYILSGYKIEIQFNKNVLVVEKSNYANKIENAYIFYVLDNWPTNSLTISQ